jgi:hypothetical protein
MKTRTAFNRVTGDRAYSIWFGYNDGDTEYLDAMMEVELDLELIAGSNGEVYAYRSNLPQCISMFFKRNGAWEFTEDTDDLCERDLFRLEVICRNFAFN